MWKDWLSQSASVSIPSLLSFTLCLDQQRRWWLCLPYPYCAVVRTRREYTWVSWIPRNRVDTSCAVTPECLKKFTCIPMPYINLAIWGRTQNKWITVIRKAKTTYPHSHLPQNARRHRRNSSEWRSCSGAGQWIYVPTELPPNPTAALPIAISSSEPMS